MLLLLKLWELDDLAVVVGFRLGNLNLHQLQGLYFVIANNYIDILTLHFKDKMLSCNFYVHNP